MNAKLKLMPLVLAAAFLGVLSFGAQAQQASRWEEPTSFLGVKLGEQESLPSCRQASANELCRAGQDRTAFLVRHVPDLGFEYTLFTQTDGAVPYMILLDTKASNFGELKTLFIERYGPPHSHKHGTVQNRMGATFSNEELTWTGPTVEIQLKERGRSVVNSDVYIMDKARATTVENRLNAEAKSKASAL